MRSNWRGRPSRVGRAAIERDVATFQREVSLKVLRSLTIVSPVDTGRFRGNWVVGIQQKNASTTEQTDRSGGLAVSLGQMAMRGHRYGQDIWISNNLPYAVRLNNGWSQQAPANFFRLAAQRVVG